MEAELTEQKGEADGNAGAAMYKCKQFSQEAAEEGRAASTPEAADTSPETKYSKPSEQEITAAIQREESSLLDTGIEPLTAQQIYLTRMSYQAPARKRFF